MGFLSLPAKNTKKNDTKGFSPELLARLGCKACPLDRIKQNKHPHLEPHGSEEPLIYVLDGPPTTRDDSAGKFFAGNVEHILQRLMPSSLRGKTRWGAIMRTSSREVDSKVVKERERKLDEITDPRRRREQEANVYIPMKEPDPIALICCKPSVVADIERTKPVILFAVGNEPLKWFTAMDRRIEKWRGRRFPAKIGSHTCWVYPISHPHHARSKRGKWADRPSEDENALEWDIARACHDLLYDEHSVLPKVDDLATIGDDVEICDGTEKGDFDRAMDMIASCYEHKDVGFDWETNALRPYRKEAKIISVALSHAKRTIAIALDHPKAGWSDEEKDDLFDAIKDWIEDAPVNKIAHGLSFELEWSGVVLGRKTVRPDHGKWIDTVSQAYVLDERSKMGKPDALSLEFLCYQYFGINLKRVSNLDRANLIEAPIRDMLRYNGLDAKYCRRLQARQMRRIVAEGLEEVFWHHNERVPTCVLTQIKGVPIRRHVNDTFFKRFRKEEQRAFNTIMELPVIARFKKLTGKDFEPSNNHHVKQLMKDLLKLKLTREGKEGESTDKKVLVQHSENAFVKALEKYRSAAKNLVTYIMPARRGSPHVYDDGKMHPILSTCQTDTSRTSSEEPNVQNWPKKKLKEVRKQVGGSEEEVVCAFDYGQIQARNIAMESLDKAFIKSFWDRSDIHADYVRMIDKRCRGWHLSPKNETEFDLARNVVKNAFVFPSFFGASYRSISGSLGLDKNQMNTVKDIQDELFDKFPGIKKWQDRLKASYVEQGYVTGHSGYRRRAPISPNQLINAPIQADEAMIVLDAMSRLSKIGWEFQPSMEIHDDLTFVWKKKNVEKNAEIVIREMLNVPYKWAHVVPLAVEFAVGGDWGSTKKIDSYFTDKWKGHDPNLGNWSDGAGWEGMEKYSDAA